SSPSLSDFVAGVEKLDSKGSNWLIFEQQFTIGVKQKEVWNHFNGTSTRPVPADEDHPTNVEKAEIAAWEKRENTALYCLTLKIPPATFARHRRRGSVANIWAAMVAEYSSKSILTRSNL
ncbi:hypothetical protein K466DRAFT_437796, partial [Polyporus arcularius HHB13444]